MNLTTAVFLPSILAFAIAGADICRNTADRVILPKGGFFERLDRAHAHFGHEPFSPSQYRSLSKTDAETAHHDLNRATVRGLLRSGDGKTFLFNDHAVVEPGKITRKILTPESPFMNDTIVEAYGFLERARNAEDFKDTFSREDFQNFFSLSHKEADTILVLGLDFELITVVDISPRGRPVYLFASRGPQKVSATPLASPQAATPPASPQAATPPASPQAATPPASPQAARNRSLFGRLDRSFAHFAHKSFSLQEYEALTKAHWQVAALDLRRAIVRGLAKFDGRRYTFLEGISSPSGGLPRDARPLSASSVGFVDGTLADVFIRLDRTRFLDPLQGIFSAQDFQSASSLPPSAVRETLELGVDAGILKREASGTGGNAYRFVRSATVPDFLKQKHSKQIESADDTPMGTAQTRSTPKKSAAELEAEINQKFFIRLDHALAHFGQGKFTTSEYTTRTKINKKTGALDLKRAAIRGLVTFDGGAYSFLPHALSASGHGIVRDALPLSPDSLGVVGDALKNSLFHLDQGLSSLRGPFSLDDFRKTLSLSAKSAREALVLGTDMKIIARTSYNVGQPYRFEENASIPDFLKGAKIDLGDPDQNFFRRLDHALAHFGHREFTTQEYRSSTNVKKKTTALDIKRWIARGLLKSHKDGSHSFLAAAASASGGAIRGTLPPSPSSIGGSMGTSLKNALSHLDATQASGTFTGAFTVHEFQHTVPFGFNKSREILLLGMDAGILSRKTTDRGDSLYYFSENATVPDFLKIADTKTSNADVNFFERLDRAFAHFSHREFTAQEYKDSTGISIKTAALDIKRWIARGLLRSNEKTYAFLERAALPSGAATRDTFPLSADSVGTVGKGFSDAFSYLDNVRSSGTFKGRFSVHDLQNAFPFGFNKTNNALLIGTDAGVLTKEVINRPEFK